MNSPYRQLLTIGVAIGVMATTLFFGVGQTLVAHREVYTEAISNHESLLRIYSPSDDGPNRGGLGISLNAALEVQESLSSTTAVSILASLWREKARYGEEILSDKILLTDHVFMDMDRITIIKGRPMTQLDMDSAARVCLISTELEAYLGPWEDLVLNLQGEPFNVVGVFSPIVATEVGAERLWGINYDSSILVPATSGYEHILKTSFRSGIITSLVAQAIDEETTYNLGVSLGRLKENNPALPHLEIASAEEEATTQLVEQLKVLGVMLLVALLVMLVAGINIIQVASANIVDRTREIGLKMAVGATRKAIYRQVTGEVLSCCLQGGIVGITLSGLMHVAINRYLDTYWASFNIITALQGLVLALLTGLITSLIPARLAVRLDPVNALRKES